MSLATYADSQRAYLREERKVDHAGWPRLGEPRQWDTNTKTIDFYLAPSRQDATPTCYGVVE